MLQGAGIATQPTAQPTPPIALQQPSAPTHSAQPSNEQSQTQLQRLIQQALSASRQPPTAGSAATPAASSAPSAASASTSGSPAAPLDTAALARTLAGLAAQFTRNGGQSAAGNREPQLPPHSLTDILQPDRVLPVLADDDYKQLAALLPTEAESDADPLSARLARHMRSAQFAQTAGRMQSLLHSENYGSLLSSLGLDMSAGGFGVEGLMAAVERLVKVDKEKAAAAAQSAQQQPQQPPSQ